VTTERNAWADVDCDLRVNSIDNGQCDSGRDYQCTFTSPWSSIYHAYHASGAHNKSFGRAGSQSSYRLTRFLPNRKTGIYTRSMQAVKIFLRAAKPVRYC
jgi:hypothetical protein